MIEIEDITDKYRLDELISNFYKIQDIEKINYAQYLPPNQNDQWSIYMEFFLRKENPKILLALLSRELWCFSINNDPLPKLPSKFDIFNQSINYFTDNFTADTSPIEVQYVQPVKYGEFNSDYSKPNLPPYYALFLKAIRRSIYINLSINSNSSLIQYGNGCISLLDNHQIISNYIKFRSTDGSKTNINSNPILQIEPHLFANGILAVSVCLKDLNLIKLKEEHLQDEKFLLAHPLYLAPSGIRMKILTENSLSSLNTPSTKSPKLWAPPPNADILLRALQISHGITLKEKDQLKWIAVIPDLDYLNGNIPSITNYNKLSDRNEKKIIWPLDLCFVQIHDVKNNINNNSIKDNNILNETSTNNDIGLKFNDTDIQFDNLNDVMSTIDDFIQIRQTAALRTPGSSGTLNTNPLSSGGAYTDQFQQYYKNTGISMLQQSFKNKISPTNSYSNVSPSLTSSMDKNIPIDNDAFPTEFSMTLITTLDNNNELFSTEKTKVQIDNSSLSPLKSVEDKRLNIENLRLAQEFHETQDRSENVMNTTEIQILNESDNIDNNDTNDKDLFGEDDEDEDSKLILIDNKESDNNQSKLNKITANKSNMDEEDDLFGEMNDTSIEEKKHVSEKATSDEITEDMFGMSDDEDNSRENMRSTIEEHPANESFSNNENKKENNKLSLKRKYLDIPLEEITLSNSPFYTDPGAPLPIETPRDKRKSVFAPLTFNPKIESDVDNKYKNGGKFSFSPTQRDEALKFDISASIVSSSDDDEGEDDESDSSFESIEYNNIKQELKLFDGSVHDTQFLNYQPMLGVQESVPPSLISGGYSLSAESYSRDTSNPIWKLSHPTNEQNLSPIKGATSNFVIDTNNVPEQSSTEEIKECLSDIAKSEDLPVSNLPVTNLCQTSSLFNTLPFLLRHIPLSLVPDICLPSNPKIGITTANEDILSIICEQIVFDNDLLNNLNIPCVTYDKIMLNPDNFISSTMQNMFPYFTTLNGPELVNKIYRMKQPFIFIKKQHEIIKIKSDSHPFGKFLNLKPPMGNKNFKFFLLTESSDIVYEMFVSTLSQAYINYEFGFCELLKLTPTDTSGLIQLKTFEQSKLLLLAAQIVSYCSTSKNLGKDATLMIILPLEVNTLNCLLSNLKVFQVIRDEVRSKIPHIDLLLKVIPHDFIKNPLTSIDEYYNLCVSIYNILWPKDIKFTAIAHKLPSKISFETLQNNDGLSAITYDSYIHIAYSRSIDKKWVFCALSDSDGKTNSVKSWYVGNSKQKFDDACTQLWTMALQLAYKKYGKICLILTRLNGILPDDELVNWRRLSSRSVHLAVVCVDEDTKNSFYDGDRMYPSFKPLVRNPKLFEMIDYSNLDNYEIVNIDDDIHGVIFQNPFPLSNSQHRCAIKSGALVRFNVTGDKTIWDKLEVNLLNCPHSDSTKLLEIVLEEFRNLAALSIWFGVSDGRTSHIPWHILAVKKLMNTLVHIEVDLNESQPDK